MTGLGIRKVSLALATLTFLGVAAIQSAAQAATVGLSSRAALAGNDSVDWGSLGSTFTNVSNPFSINSVGGNTLEVTKPSGSFGRRDQNNGWAGNFSTGDRLLWTQNSAPLQISFQQAIARVGSNIQANYYGAFTATITAFDSLGNTLGSFSRSGNSTSNGDGSAIFLGIGSDQANISRLEFRLPSASIAPEDFAINSLSISSQPVPEPLTILGSLTAGGFGVVLRRKQKQQQKATAKA